MSIPRVFRSSVIAAAGMFLSCAAFAADKDVPPVIKKLQEQGLTHVKPFDAGKSLKGYAGVLEQQPLAVYVTEDGSAIVGTRLGADGSRVDDAKIRDLVVGPMSKEVWQQLDKSTWVADGKANAPRVVYTFSDPNCPYCHRFWDAARPWVDAGKVQLRHVMVGIIRADSAPKAAAILTASDKSAALLENERKFSSGGIKAAPSVPADVRKKLDANQALMVELGFRGTPGIIWLDDKGQMQKVNGMPQGEAMNAVMGPR